MLSWGSVRFKSWTEHVDDGNLEMLNMLRSSVELIEAIGRRTPAGHPSPFDQELIDELTQLTARLIDAYGVEGRLDVHPFARARMRHTVVLESEVRPKIRNATVLVTGGAGCIGTHLILALQKLGTGRIVSVDVQPGFTSSDATTARPVADAAHLLDIRDAVAMANVFAREKPEVVFHLAAQRDPGLAERSIRETITTNIFGSRNVIDLCMNTGVRTLVCASSGKAMRYFSPDVYATTKKFLEWQIVRAASTGDVACGIARFTHIADNSLLAAAIRRQTAAGMVGLHGPGRYFNVQTAGEAVNLLLNALACAVPGETRLVTSADHGWPVESLQLALYEIRASGKPVPVRFLGTPAGYEDYFFQGHLALERADETHLLINALESMKAMAGSTGDFVIAEPLPCTGDVLDHCIGSLQAASDAPGISAEAFKSTLIEVEKRAIESALSRSPPGRLLQILQWGCDERILAHDRVRIERYSETVELIVRALGGRLQASHIADAKLTSEQVLRLVSTLGRLPALYEEIQHLSRLARTAATSAP